MSLYGVPILSSQEQALPFHVIPVNRFNLQSHTRLCVLDSTTHSPLVEPEHTLKAATDCIQSSVNTPGHFLQKYAESISFVVYGSYNFCNLI